MAMWGMLVLTSLVGLFLGLAVSASVRNLAAAAAVLIVCFGAMIALGGWIWPMPTMNSPLRLAANAMPTRWAFEGLLLLETAEYHVPVTTEETASASNYYAVEVFSPPVPNGWASGPMRWPWDQC